MIMFRCQLLHRTAGDTERRYHLRYYKTGMCVHDTDNRSVRRESGLAGDITLIIPEVTALKMALIVHSHTVPMISDHQCTTAGSRGR